MTVDGQNKKIKPVMKAWKKDFSLEANDHYDHSDKHRSKQVTGSTYSLTSCQSVLACDRCSSLWIKINVFAISCHVIPDT